MVKKKIKQAVCSVSCIVVIMTAGCLQTPDVEYVTNKEGQNTLISDNVAVDNGTPIRQQVQAPERATGVCDKVNEYTTIEVDAAVITPNSTTVPVYMVKPIQLDTEAVETYTGILFETGEFYNREYNTFTPSVEALNEEIEICIKNLETAEITTVSEPVLDENGIMIEMNAEYAQILRERLDFLQEELTNALEQPGYGSPVNYDFVEKVSKIAIPIRNKNGNGYVLSDEVTCDYTFHYSAFRGRHNGIEYDFSAYQDGLNTELRFALPWDSRISNGFALNEIVLETEHKGSYIAKPNTCNYSQEEAVALCKDFLAELGIENMQAQYITDVYMIYKDGQVDEEFLGKKGWKVYLYWGCGDMAECFSPNYDSRIGQSLYISTISMLEWEMGDSFVQEMNENEEISTMKTMKGMAIFTVLDDGIIDAWIQNPMENKELLAENVKLLHFDQILEQGMAHLETLYGDSGSSGSSREKNIRIRMIELNYARMQSPDTEGEFAMIPVWDFKTDINGESMVSINAIDGSTFDREKGH